jgi:hypothetical protein
MVMAGVMKMARIVKVAGIIGSVGIATIMVTTVMVGMTEMTAGDGIAKTISAKAKKKQRTGILTDTCPLYYAQSTKHVSDL